MPEQSDNRSPKSLAQGFHVTDGRKRGGRKDWRGVKPEAVKKRLKRDGEKEATNRDDVGENAFTQCSSFRVSNTRIARRSQDPVKNMRRSFV